LPSTPCVVDAAAAVAGLADDVAAVFMADFLEVVLDCAVATDGV